MRGHVHAFTAAAIAAVCLIQAPVWGQAEPSSGAAAKQWRTEFGTPDLQGMWNFSEDALTPLEKPTGEVKLLKTREEVVQDFESRVEIGPPGHWTELKPRTEVRWLLREPDGKMPPLTPWAQERSKINRTHHDDSWEYQSPFERCISRGVPGAILPVGVTYNHSVHILQTRQHVVFRFEMFDTWIVPVDGRPHLGKDIRLWTGDPRGRWDGDTLVIDVTNFHGQARPLVQFLGSEARHVVMRVKRVDDNTLDFEASIDDPNVFTKSWTVGVPLKRDPTYRMFEYACHEGNVRAMTNTLAGTRAQEREAAAKGGK